MEEMKHTPGPWKWQGEDYRGGWGWQLLVGPSGEGIVCGEDDGSPYSRLSAYVAIDPKYCKTGMMADEDSAPSVHVRQADARLIAAAPELLDALQGIIDDMDSEFGTGYDYDKARAAITKATGQSK